MRVLLIIVLLSGLMNCSNPPDQNSKLKSVLLEQLKNTHTNEDWFAPTKVALEGINAQQAFIKDSTDNHSIAQLVSHLIFWNERVLTAFKTNTKSTFDGNNNETFKPEENKAWEAEVAKLDSIQNAWEEAVQNASDQQLTEWASTIANVCSHNAYHTGQIIYIRKQNGWWKS